MQWPFAPQHAFIKNQFINTLPACIVFAIIIQNLLKGFFIPDFFNPANGKVGNKVLPVRVNTNCLELFAYFEKKVPKLVSIFNSEPDNTRLILTAKHAGIAYFQFKGFHF